MIMAASRQRSDLDTEYGVSCLAQKSLEHNIHEMPRLECKDVANNDLMAGMGNLDCKVTVMDNKENNLDEERQPLTLEYEKEEQIVPDGGWGWIVCLGSFMVNFILDGTLFSFGVLLLELLDDFGTDKATTSWVGSAQMGIHMCMGPVISALLRRYSIRQVTIVGALVAAAGFVLSVFSPNIYVLILTFGVMGGIGFGMTFLPAIIVVGLYFNRKRAIATGIATSGSGVGTFAFAYITNALLSEYGWRGTVLILAGIVLNCAVCGMMFRPLLTRPSTTTQVSKVSDEPRKPSDGASCRIPAVAANSDHQSASSGYSSDNQPTPIKSPQTNSDSSVVRDGSQLKVFPVVTDRKSNSCSEESANTESMVFRMKSSELENASSFSEFRSSDEVNGDGECVRTQSSKRKGAPNGLSGCETTVPTLVILDTDEIDEPPSERETKTLETACFTKNRNGVKCFSIHPRITHASSTERNNNTHKDLQCTMHQEYSAESESVLDKSTNECFPPFSNQPKIVTSDICKSIMVDFRGSFESRPLSPRLYQSVDHIHALTKGKREICCNSNLSTESHLPNPRLLCSEYKLSDLNDSRAVSLYGLRQPRHSQHDPEVHSQVHKGLLRPILRKDIYYSGSVSHLPQYQHFGGSLATFMAAMTRDSNASDHDPHIIKATETLNDGGCYKNMDGFLPTRLLTNNMFLLLLITFTMWTAQSVSLNYVPDLAVTMGIDKSDAAFLISIVGIANVLGRLFSGFINDCFRLPSIWLYVVALLTGSLVNLMIPFCHSYLLLQICSALFGLCMAVAVSMRTIVLAEQLGIEVLTESFGVVALCQGVAFTINPPIAGKLIDDFDSFKPPFIMASVMYAVSGIAALVVGCLGRSQLNKLKQTQTTEMELMVDTRDDEISLDDFQLPRKVEGAISSVDRTCEPVCL